MNSEKEILLDGIYLNERYVRPFGEAQLTLPVCGGVARLFYFSPHAAPVFAFRVPNQQTSKRGRNGCRRDF